MYASMTALFLGDPMVGGLFMGLVVLVLFLPSSRDPLTTIPPERLELWPLTRAERYGLRALSPLLNPIAWLVIAGLIWQGVPWGVWVFAASLFLCGFIGSSFRVPRVWIPRLPLGALTELVRKDLKQFLTALDFYCALVIAAPATYLRIGGKLPAAAHLPVAGLIVLTTSTMALTLFGLDGESGMTRYHLYPLSPLTILASKSVAYLLLTVVVTLPLAPVYGLAGGLGALAVGQFASVKQVVPQVRWRFRASSPFAYSLAQMLLAVFAVFTVEQLGLLGIGACFAAYAFSLWLCIQHWKRAAESTRP